MLATKIPLISILTFLISSPTSIFVSAFALSDISPFIPPFLDDLDFITTSNTSSTSDLSNNDILGKELRKRGSCPSNYKSCSTLAAADDGSCCTKNAVCSLDAASQVACCPTGAVCTGTISVPTTTSGATPTPTSSGGFALGGSTVSSVTSTTFTSPTSTAASQTTTYLTNSFFNFPMIPSTYPNSIACLSAFSACQTNYAHCTQDLQGGSFGVTISAQNGGTTVESKGTLSLGVASATSICSSLSERACLGIRSTQCSEFGSASATTTVGFVTGTSGGRRGVGCGGMVMAAGVGAGVWGGWV